MNNQQKPNVVRTYIRLFYCRNTKHDITIHYKYKGLTPMFEQNFKSLNTELSLHRSVNAAQMKFFKKGHKVDSQNTLLQSAYLRHQSNLLLDDNGVVRLPITDRYGNYVAFRPLTSTEIEARFIELRNLNNPFFKLCKQLPEIKELYKEVFKNEE